MDCLNFFELQYAKPTIINVSKSYKITWIQEKKNYKRYYFWWWCGTEVK
jgi:hypothetical protein